MKKKKFSSQTGPITLAVYIAEEEEEKKTTKKSQDSTKK
jgi:hypothetical protein